MRRRQRKSGGGVGGVLVCFDDGLFVYFLCCCWVQQGDGGDGNDVCRLDENDVIDGRRVWKVWRVVVVQQQLCGVGGTVFVVGLVGNTVCNWSWHCAWTLVLLTAWVDL